MADYDSVVIGGGVMGYSAALALVKQGRTTALLEQFPTPHTRGSSTGHSRITRVANYGHPTVTAIMVDALTKWKEIQAETGTKLFIPYPMLCVGKGKSIDRMRESIKASGNEAEECSAQQTNDRFGCNFDADVQFIMDPEAGVLLADKCIMTLKSLFESHGGTILDQHPVTGVRPGTDGQPCEVSTTAARSKITANRVILCCGPWTGKLLQTLGVTLPLTPMKVAAFYWKQKDASTPAPMFVATDIPNSFNCSHYYGLPSVEYPGMVKVSPHSGIPCDPDKRDFVSIEPLQRNVEGFVRKYMPFLEDKPSIIEDCMYTVTPDEEMILDYVNGCRNIVYACGFSGSGFKMGPTIGLILSQMVTGKKSDFDIGLLSAERFTKSKY